MTKYILTDETIQVDGKTLHRIELTEDCKWGTKGTKGGFIESTSNLRDDAWVSGNANVFDNARVYGNAWVSGNAKVFDNARVYGDAWVFGNAHVFGDANIETTSDLENMTIFEYLKISKEFNLITDSFYAYGDKLVVFKRKFMVDKVSRKITTSNKSLSEQLKIPVVLIPTTIPEGLEIPHLIIKSKSGETLYTEHIIEKPNRHLATPINHIPSIIKVRGLVLKWEFHTDKKNFFVPRPQEKLLTPDNFNTIYPDGSKFDILKYGEIVEPLPPTIQL